jgi:hypothetical protein
VSWIGRYAKLHLGEWWANSEYGGGRSLQFVFSSLEVAVSVGKSRRSI